MKMLTLFLCSDVMSGRGIDQILWHPSTPEVHEPYVRDARDYVELAEQASGPIPRSVGPKYIWGDALDELDRVAPHARIINLETSITRSDDYWKGKGINYRMHPENIACLTVARIDVCTLGNNHVLDCGYEGLQDTLTTLKGAGLRSCGAGCNLGEAREPAILEVEDGRLVVWSVGTESSGVPPIFARQHLKRSGSTRASTRRQRDSAAALSCSRTAVWRSDGALRLNLADQIRSHRGDEKDDLQWRVIGIGTCVQGGRSLAPCMARSSLVGLRRGFVTLQRSDGILDLLR